MAEYSGKSNEDLASQFIVATCQLLPRSNYVTSNHMHDLIRAVNRVPKQYVIVCGSSEEFYIQPLNTCIDDNDYLVCQTDRLAFTGNFPVLPGDVSGLDDMIKCYNIESNVLYPGFVRLRAMGKMNYNWKCKMYEFSKTVRPGRPIYLNLDMVAVANMHGSHHPGLLGKMMPNTVSGPAVTTQNEFDLSANDVVYALFCPQWPREAQYWPLRQRIFEWPTIDTIAEVVQNGCHVVYVQHRACRNNIQQWRLSFSEAELVLLQSWTKHQQIVYHLLRFFAKKELIQKNCPKADQVLCTYHIKTLMLWTCEKMSSERWNAASVITICCELFKKLSNWLHAGWCRNYFVPEANLFFESSSSTLRHKIERRLNKFQNADILSHWFVDNYILPITSRPTQSKRCSIEKVVPDFMDYLQPLLELRKKHESLALNILFTVRFTESHQKCRSSFKCGFKSGLKLFLKSQDCLNSKAYSEMAFLPTTEKILCFKYFDFLLYILHSAYGLRYGEISWNSSIFIELVEVMSVQTKIVRSEYHNFPKTYTKHSSRFQFLRAQNLMQDITGSNSRSEFQLLSLMSKEFLRESLKYDDAKSIGIAPAALAYLAALCFATSEYDQAMRLCLAVLEDPVSTLDNKETLNAGCLLFIDDVARIVGFSVLHKKIANNNLQYTNRRLYLDLRLSPEVFAHYITILFAKRMVARLGINHDSPYPAFAMDECLKVLSAESINSHLECFRDLFESAFPMDDYLKALTKSACISLIDMKMSCTQFIATRQVVYCRKIQLGLTDTDANPSMVEASVIDILMEIALENMTTFYGVMGKDFGIQCNTADCYRALYLYKCHKYNDVLHICEQILHEPDLQNHLKKFAFVNVLLLPPLDSYFDEDVQSLLGFHTLFYYLPALNNDVGKVEINEVSASALWFARDVGFQRIGLSECLKTCEPMNAVKCPYFIGRHFLARYLKVRCFNDCNLPYSETLTEFAAHKTDHQFEHIIREFLLRKLSAIKQ